MRRHGIALLAGVFALTGLAAACGNDGRTPYDPANDPEVTKEARAKFPTVMALHEQVIARSCTPNGGVCHNMKEYPDLHTPGNFVTIAGKPCNEDKAADPSQYYDGCEPSADEMEIPSIGFRTRVASISGDLYDGLDAVYREVTLEKEAPSSQYAVAARFLRNGAVIAEVPANLTLTEGSRTARLEQIYNLDYQTYLALGGVTGGDPNGNGVFGADDAWHEITPGHPEKSYLIGRITGTVKGSRMPLANQPLSEPEYVALFCWIEGTSSHPSPDDRIDYDGCRFAKNPVDYTIH